MSDSVTATSPRNNLQEIALTNLKKQNFDQT